ncbi:MAG: alpha/beta hydrolase [Rubrivivax sp.]|nr:alpha/beta hydrolase [Rubrivivax sp.]
MNPPAPTPPTPAPFVLVHGAWGGAWIWRRVLAPLRVAGHEVHAVTLSGDGDRAHLRHRGIRLAHHVADVVAAVQAEELRGAILVGHSYGGMVVTGAADRLLDADAQAVRAIVYVDAMVPLPGEGWGDAHSPEIVAARTAAAEAHDFALPPPDPRDFGLEGADRDWLLRRQVPHPFGPYRDPLPFDGERWAGLPRTFIDCNAPAYPTIDAMRARVRALPGFRVEVIPTGHCPMVSAPAALVRLLLDAAARAG